MSMTIHQSYKTHGEIFDFKKLQPGWCPHGDGISFSDRIISIALKLNFAAIENKLFETKAFPGCDGEIEFVIYCKNHWFEFMIENDGVIEFSHEYDSKEIESENISMSMEEALEKIKEIQFSIDKCREKKQ